VRVNGSPARASRRVRVGDLIEVTRPRRVPTQLLPEDIPLEVVYEDDSLAVVEKPAGMVVHPAAGHRTGTLVHALLHRYGALPTSSGHERAGIVHRIDKGTSGLLLVARTEAAHRDHELGLPGFAAAPLAMTIVGFDSHPIAHLSLFASVSCRSLARPPPDCTFPLLANVISRPSPTPPPPLLSLPSAVLHSPAPSPYSLLFPRLLPRLSLTIFCASILHLMSSLPPSNIPVVLPSYL